MQKITLADEFYLPNWWILHCTEHFACRFGPTTSFTITTDLFRRFFLIQKVHFLESADISVDLNLFIKWIIMETIQHGNTSFFNSFIALNSNLQGIKLFNQFYLVSMKVPLCSQMKVGLLNHFCEIKLFFGNKTCGNFLTCRIVLTFIIIK